MKASDPVTDTLPALQTLPDLRAALAEHPLVLLQAPPGAGKSTALPLQLLDEPWLAGQRVLLLQPRRVAVRGVAARLAASLGEAVGETVGSRVRFETKVSDATRLEVVTEGILTRRLQRDPELSGVGLVILDEFHERSLNADLALALLREVQGALRDDLRVLLMSATLDESLPARLGAPLVRSEGRAYPVELRYAAQEPAGRTGPAVAAAVRRALAEEAGDVLAFLPGVAEIREAQAALSGVEAVVRPLYGDLPPAEQSRAILPDPAGRRRVILATSIAETSLTIEGVRVVVDSGQRRSQAYDPSTGLSGLRTGRVTRAEAEQRAGRAGRTAPGVAYRLWPERTQALLAADRPPEILAADLAPLRLELAAWGVTEAGGLEWLDAPPASAWAAAGELLRGLGALDAEGRITPAGQALLRFPTHPRLAHLLAAAADPALAADVAALLEERGPRLDGADLTERVNRLRQARAAGRLDAWAGAERLSRQWRQLLDTSATDSPADPYAVGRLLALAYPERVALARAGGGGRFLLAGGQGAELPPGGDLSHAGALAVAHLDGVAEGRRGPEGRIFLAAPLHRRDLAAGASWQPRTEWDPRTGRLLAQEELRCGALVLDTRPLTASDPAAEAAAVAAAVAREGLHLLTFSPEAQALRDRVGSLRAWRPDEGWPDLSDAALLSTAADWLAPFLGGVRSREALARLDLLPALTALLPWELQTQLDELAPTHLTVPSGSRVRLDYAPDGSPPVLAVKLQELFGLEDTPTVNRGRTAVLLHLLSPARRPVQVTQDLRSFWASGYFEVRKDLRGRYPKHPWPDDPAAHVPTAKTKRALERGS
ncbi:ATP-dependent helicase HrpB [Deinococcus proteolyticus MRP]|uniref:ATP-dependent helicase HrpB n=1 Tax=Deinococcus proteolyticus (strain ATCC 35074 / DSM 20540 / JCM 6276 / NBRC 101906 / NCIMB 13154 / VKM Ac-1939 / CCM 2703 / MRP) TaxID=693977 RepID=F0RM77_DEIPM|nr:MULTISPECIES: ATP-dependent helicase HrpB [Deinococcus]ADY25997.1 ATP-dependent helicase HrpB [Deinococcus proteolyticus MRP]MCY1702118.1 ATP-dependent helicase HrpB [Deinococcus sp. SL84]